MRVDAQFPKIIWVVSALRQSAFRDRELYTDEDWHEEACLSGLAEIIMDCQTFSAADHELHRAARFVRAYRRAQHLAPDENIKPMSEVSANALADEIQQIRTRAHEDVRSGQIRRIVCQPARNGNLTRTADFGGDVLVLSITFRRWADANRRLRRTGNCSIVEGQLKRAASIAAGIEHFDNALAQIHLSLATSATVSGPGFAGTGGAPTRAGARHILRRVHRAFEIARRYEYCPNEGS